MLFFNFHSMVFARLPWPWSEIGKFCPLPEPIRLQDSEDTARSRTEKKINYVTMTLGGYSCELSCQPKFHWISPPEQDFNQFARVKVSNSFLNAIVTFLLFYVNFVIVCVFQGNLFVQRVYQLANKNVFFRSLQSALVWSTIKLTGLWLFWTVPLRKWIQTFVSKLAVIGSREIVVSFSLQAL